MVASSKTAEEAFMRKSTLMSAADLYVPPPAPAPIPVASGMWEGPYIGAFVGYASGFADHLNPGPPVNFPDGADASLAGWLLGAKAGVNFYLSDGVVAGLVGDIAWSDISGSGGGPYPVIGNSTSGINWQGSLRGILGFDGGTFMPYLTAGLGVANAWHNVDGGAVPINHVTATHVGWTAGAGVNVAVADSVSLNLEYRYSNFGTQTYVHNTNLPDPPQYTLTQHSVTAGINFHF
jgi:opacity protein-like surface antigen